MKTTFDMSRDLRDAMEEARASEGYPVKRKSAWICEAIERLPIVDPRYARVGLAEALSKVEVKFNVTLTAQAREVIRVARATIRAVDPDAEGLTGQIIRAAVRLRIEEAAKWVA